MAKQSSPYVRYLCPCTDLESPSSIFDGLATAANGNHKEAAQENEENKDHTINPHVPRANYNLYPLEHLVFCNECYEIRCPECYYEEALQYFCPGCLFETQSSLVKSETNRCTRSCFQCPLCVASLQVNSFQDPDEVRPESRESASVGEGQCLLACPWCSWTSLEIGLVFEKPVNLSGQLAKLKNGHSIEHDPNASGDAIRRDADAAAADHTQSDPDQYSQLASFYRNQISETTPSGPFGLNPNYGLDSPNTLTRLLSTYGLPGLKKHKEKLPLMREALSKSEGLRPVVKEDAEEAIIAQMQNLGWDGTLRVEQVQHQDSPVRFVPDVRPVSMRLRTRRAKRCRTCRYNLVKPDEKRGKFRYQIKLVALNFIPTISVKPMNHSTDLDVLAPGKSYQFLVTFRNPLFDLVKVTLATSQITPGKIRSRVTVLCPEFEIGANTDVWDDALDTTTNERKKAREALEGIQPEAGRIWEKGRNWTSIIVEVVPGSPINSLHQAPTNTAASLDNAEPENEIKTVNDNDIEIPLFVRLEHEADDTGGDALGKESSGANTKDRKIKRELSYWCVLGVGRLASADT